MLVVALAALPGALTTFSRRKALLTTAGLPLLPLHPLSTTATSPPSFEAGTKAAFAAFAAGEYRQAEELWSRAVETYPQSSLAWANLATLLIINASDEMKLGELPTGEASRRLERALAAIEQSEALGSTDAVLLNSRGLDLRRT